MNPVSMFSRKCVARADGTFGIIISAVVAIAVCATPDGKNSPEEAWLTLQQSCASCRDRLPLGIFWGKNWSWDQKELCNLDLPVPTEAQGACLLLSRYVVAIKEMIKKNGLWDSSLFSCAGSWDFSTLVSSNDMIRKASCKRRIKYQCPNNLWEIH